MTADPRIGQDAAEFFKNMSIGNLQGIYRYLIVSPVSLKSRILQMMDEEITKGNEGRIIMKMNSVTDVDFIKKSIRGLLRRSKGRLDCSRNLLYTTGSAWIYGKCQSDECGWPLSGTSTYLQLRNWQRAEDLYRLRRYDDKEYRKKSRSSLPGIRRQIRRQINHDLKIMLSDNVKARIMQKDGTYMKRTGGIKAVDSQAVFMEEAQHGGREEDQRGPGITGFLSLRHRKK